MLLTTSYLKLASADADSGPDRSGIAAGGGLIFAPGLNVFELALRQG